MQDLEALVVVVEVVEEGEELGGAVGVVASGVGEVVVVGVSGVVVVVEGVSGVVVVGVSKALVEVEGEGVGGEEE